MSYESRTRFKIFIRLLMLAALVAAAVVVMSQLLGSNKPEVELDSDFQQQLLQQISNAKTGQRIDIPVGQYQLDTSLLLQTDGLQLIGAGASRSKLSFIGMEGDKPAIQVDADNITVRGIGLLDAPATGILVSASDNIVLTDIETAAPRSNNEQLPLSYGVIVRRARNVVIENNQLRAARDAGLYVLDSDEVLIRNNQILTNTLGVVLASSRSVDLSDNNFSNNSMGISLVNFPRKVSAPARNIRIFDNRIAENNRNNLFSSAEMAQLVFVGVGIHISAVDKVEIFGNTLIKNSASNIVVFSEPAEGFPDLVAFDPFAEGIFIYNNFLNTSGMAPANLANLRGNNINLPFPDILYDGVVDPLQVDSLRKAKSGFRFCLKDNGDFRFVNLDADGHFQGRSRLLDKVSCEPERLPVPAITAANPKPAAAKADTDG